MKGILILLLIISIKIYSQPPSIQWEKTFGGSGNERFYSIILTFDSNIIVSGFTSSMGGYIVNQHGDEDAWLLKIDQLGNILWNKCYGGPSSEIAYSIKQTTDSGFVISADAYFNGGDVSGIHNFSSDYWIIKTNHQGDIQWSKCYGGSADDVVRCIIQTSDSGFCAIGSSLSLDYDVTGNNGQEDIWVLKISPDSLIQWKKCLGGALYDSVLGGECCIQLSDSSYLIGADVSSNNGLVSGNHGGTDVWIVKLNLYAQVVWQKCYGGSSLDNVEAIIPADNNGFYAAGYSSSNDGDVQSSIGGGDFWLFKADSSGTILWEKSFGGSSIEVANAMCKTSDGGLALAGHTYSNDSQVTGLHGFNDYWVVKVDSLGNFEWGKVLGGTQQEEAFAILQTPDNGLLVAGSTHSNDGDVSVNLGGTDAWVVKLAPAGLAIPEMEYNLQDLYIYQFSDLLYLRFFSKHNQNVQMSIYDIEGRKVFTEEVFINEGINYHQITCSEFARGIYCLRINGNSFVQSQKVLIEN